MDKRDLADLFRARLGELVARAGSSSRFSKLSGLDRSALSQFLDPAVDRLPRAETLRQIAEAARVSADWLIGLSNASDTPHELSPSVEIEMVVDAAGVSPLVRWRREAMGQKLRYVPSNLPDMLCLPEMMDYELEGDRATARKVEGEQMLGTALGGDMDLEIAMPHQSLEDLSVGSGIWQGLDAAARRRQLAHMARVVEKTYPALRLHLYDGRRTFAAPFTVFGTIRASVYLGGAYLVVTSSEQVRAMARMFDGLVRAAHVPSDRAGRWLADLAKMT